MAGQPTNRERGIPGGQVILDVKFYDHQGGRLVDDDRYAAEAKVPDVEIYDPSGHLIVSTTQPNTLQANRRSIGYYDYVYPIPLNAVISDQYRIVWKIRINGNDLQFHEYFAVVEPGDANFGEEEYRVGFAFGNPDLTSTRHATVNYSSKVGHPDLRGWGLLMTPDEMRYMVLFGTKLVSPDASQTYDDNMLLYYIENAIAMIERDLNIDIFPRVVRHEDPIDNTTQYSAGSLAGESAPVRLQGARVPRRDLPPETEEPNRIREQGYPYRPNPARHYMHIKLRRRPLIDVLKCVMVDPVMNTVLDLYNWRRENPGFEASVQFFPNLSSVGNYPFIPSKLLQAQYPFPDFPAAIYIDYRTGFLNAKDVPVELRQVVYWLAGIHLLNDFGDGKSPGLASASMNLNSVSESYTTTQSATNALYGARILSFQKMLETWWKRNAHKYQRSILGVL